MRSKLVALTLLIFGVILLFIIRVFFLKQNKFFSLFPKQSQPSTLLYLTNIEPRSVTLLNLNSNYQEATLLLENNETKKLTIKNGLIAINSLKPATDYSLKINDKVLSFKTKSLEPTMPYLVYGKIVDAQNKPQKNEIVLLKGNQEWWAAATDERGLYWFNLFTQNEENITLSLPTKKEPSLQFALNNNDITVPTLILQNNNNLLATLLPTIKLPWLSSISAPQPKNSEIYFQINLGNLPAPNIDIAPPPLLPPVSLPPITIPMPSLPPIVLPSPALPISPQANPLTLPALPPISQLSSQIPDAIHLFSYFTQNNIEVQKIVGIDNQGNIKQLTLQIINGHQEWIGENFSLTNIESILYLLKGGNNFQTLLTQTMSLTTIIGKFNQLISGKSAVIGLMGSDLTTYLKINTVGELIDYVLKNYPDSAGLLISFLDEKTGLITTITKVVSVIISSDSSYGLPLEAGKTYLISLWNKYLGQLSPLESNICSGSNTNSCCPGLKTSSNTSGLYPPGYRSPGPQGGLYECKSGYWQVITAPSTAPLPSTNPINSPLPLSSYQPSLPTCEYGLVCKAQGGILNGGTECVSNNQSLGISVIQICCSQGQIMCNDTCQSPPCSSIAPSISPPPVASSIAFPSALPSIAPLPSIIGIAKGTCVEHITGKGCINALMCQGVNETNSTCTASDNCTSQACVSEAWSKGDAEASRRAGVKLDRNSSFFNCQTTFTGEPCE